MKSILIAFALFFGSGSCYLYDELIEETIKEVDLQMQMYTNTTLTNFYTHIATTLEMQFEQFAQGIAESGNPYAIAHVITFRQNYTAVPFMIDQMINDTRDDVAKIFEFQRNNMKSLIPMIKPTCDDVDFILREKFCNETVKEQFYMNLVSKTGLRVATTLNEGYQAYISQLMNQFVPFSLYNYMIMEMEKCTNPVSGNQVDTIDCLVQKDDLYLVSTMNLVSQSLKSIGSLINQFNLKLTYQAMKDVDTTFSNAYRDVYLLKC